MSSPTSTPAVEEFQSEHQAAEPAPARNVRFAALQSRNFRFLWFGLLITNAGTWMESTASGWLVTDLEPGRASLWLGVIAASFAVPMLLLPPFGGAVADRFSRLRLLWIFQTLYLVLSVVLAIVTLTDIVAIWMLVAYAFANGVVLAFDSPVRHAMLPEIVNRDQFTSGVSLNSVAFTGAALVGPAIAGALIPVIGVGGVMTLNAFSCIATLYALAQLRDLPEPRPTRPPGESILRSIGRGIHYISSSPVLSGLILVSTITGLLARSYTPLLAVFARDEFHVGSGAYGALVSVGGLGTLIGAFGLAGRREVEHRGRLIAVAAISQALLLLLFSISPWYALSLPLLLLVGVMNALTGASIATLIQLSVPGELRGRVMSLYMLTVIGIPSIGAFLLGAMAIPLGVRGAVGVAAVVVVGAVAAIFASNTALREAD
jgi:MFS family permease